MSEGKRFLIGFVVAVVLVFSTVTLFLSIELISAGHRGVVLTWGAVSDRIMDEGLNWKTPYVQSVKEMSVQTERVSVDASASSKDLQVVSTRVTLNYQLQPAFVNDIYQRYRKDYSERVMMPTILEFVKKTTAKFTAEELITKRQEVKADLQGSIFASLEKSHITSKDIFITDFNFSDSFNQAIEAKVEAEQLALKAKNDLERKKFEAQQIIVKEEANARAIEIKAQAITQEGGVEYVALMAVEKWNGVLPTQMIPGGSVPFINVTKLGEFAAR
jgi:regulator of protease activity HflC (stomatin/prohibitin superfamily)